MAGADAGGREELQRLLRRQDLVISRTQALTCGMSPEALRYRVRPGGPWQPLVRGVYLTVTGTPTVRQREIAAALYGGRGSVMTGLAALRLYRARVPEPKTIKLLAPVSHPRRRLDFIEVWPTRRMPEAACCEGVVQFALPARAVADATRELDGFRQVRAIVAGAVQQRLCTVAALQVELAKGPVRGSAWLRQALGEVADGVRSAAEGDFRDLLRRAHLPIPMFNARLFKDRTFLAIADAWWPDAGVAAEVDSREWHISPEDWSYTLKRHARLSAHSIVVLHFTPAQIRDEPQEVVANLRSALAEGRARPTLPIRALPADA